MDEKEFKAEIKRGLEGGYLICGEEDYLKDYWTEQARLSVVGDDDFSSFNTVQSDEASYTDAFLPEALESTPMFSDKICVICRVRFAELKEDGKEKLIKAIDHLDATPHAVLLLVVPSGALDCGEGRRGKTSKDFERLTKYLKPVVISEQPAYVLRKWVERHLAAEGLTAADGAAEYLIEKTGGSMMTLSRELEKLICYVLSKDAGCVECAAVDDVCSDQGELDAFALSNAIVSGERDLALAAIRECRIKKQKPTYVLAQVTSEFINMTYVLAYMNDGMPKEAIAKKMSIHPFRVGKYMAALRGAEPAELRAMIDRCAECDRTLKSMDGSFDPLIRLVCTIPSKKKIARSPIR